MKGHLSLLALLFSTMVFAQEQNPAPPIYPAPGSPAETESRRNVAQQQDSQMPVFRVNVYARSAKAVNYRNRGGSTTLDMKGTDLMPAITGRAKVDGKEIFHSKRAEDYPGLVVPIQAAIPPGSKQIEFIVDHLKNNFSDHSIWAYPVFQ